MLLWWQSDPRTAHEIWHSDKGSLLQFGIPPALAGAGWIGQQLLSRRLGRSTPAQLEVARRALIGRSREWWRGIPEPAWPGHVLRAGLRPLAVTWSQAGAANAQLTGTVTDVQALAAAFRRDEPFRLVISGAAGTGKSVLACVIMTELLKRPRPADPVPVFLPAWSWDPSSEGLNEWLKRRLAATYPELSDSATYGPTAIANLVDQGRILPIIDGIDALPPDRRAAVLDDGQLISQDRLIMTARVFEPVPGFTVFSPRNVSTEAADQFLTDVTRQENHPWASRKLAGGTAELPPELANPRIVYLTSICYRSRDSTRQMIGRTARAGHDLGKTLVAGLIPALMPTGGDWAGKFPWYANAGLAERWIGHLARLDLRAPAPPTGASENSGAALRDPGNSRIIWWNLHRGAGLLGTRQAFIRAAITAAIIFPITAAQFTYHDDGLYSVMTAGAYAAAVLLAGLVLGAESRPRVPANPDADDPGPEPAHADLERGPARSWLAAPLSRHRRVIAATVGVFLVFGLLIWWRQALQNPKSTHDFQNFATGLWDGLNLALIVAFTSVVAGVPCPPRTAEASDIGVPSGLEKYKFVPSVSLGMLFGLLWGVTAVIKHQAGHTAVASGPALLTGLGTGLFFVLGCWIFAWTRAWFRARPAANPLVAARQDLAGTLVGVVILGTTFGFAFGVDAHFKITVVDAIAWVIVGVALASLGSEWPLYFLAVTGLAARKRVPFRLLRFLECCRKTGVMRVVGEEYQIHDDGLLEYLVSGEFLAAQAARRPTPTAAHWVDTMSPPAARLAKTQPG